MADNPDTNYCSNCKRQIAAANFIMHEVHCRRNIVLCEKCEEPVPRSEMSSHFDEEHALTPCPLCEEEFEISKIEDHKPTCPKRNVHCDFCQLDMPKCDLENHMSYCGTRTEPCPLCSQFIMLRDMEQHEDSACSYPPPKPSPAEDPIRVAPGISSRPNNQRREPESLADLNPEMSSFAMNELSRLLNEPGMMPGPSSSSSSSRNNISEQNITPSIRNSRQSRSNLETNRRSRIAPRQPLHMNRNISRAKRTNETAGQRSKNVNVPPVNNNNVQSNGAPSGPGDLDELLARHLAQDLGSEYFAPISDDGLRFGDNDLRETRRRDSASPEPDDVSLPCEFCGDLFPLEFLVQHQGACNPFESEMSQPVNITPSPSSLNEYTDSIPNNHSPRRSTVSSNYPSHPHIVDNLSNESAQAWFSGPSAGAGNSDEETMLPCEFCDNLFPDDILVQHQAVCDHDRSSTPHHRAPEISRPMGVSTRANQGNWATRNEAHSRGKSNLGAASGGGPPANRARQRSRRQADPVFDFRGTPPADETSFGAAGAGPRNRKSSGNRRVQTRDSGTNSEMHSVGVRSRVEGMSSFKSRNNNRRTPSSRNGAFASGSDNSQARDISPEMRRAGSAANVHRTLEQLLQDPGCSTDELLAALDKEEKSNRNQRTKEATNGADNRQVGELSLTNAISGTKPRNRRGQRSPSEPDGHNRYDPSFPRPAPRVSNKPKPVQPRAADYTGTSYLRVNKPRNPLVSVEGNSRGAEGSRTPTSSQGNGQRKRTNSRPRKAPQGEP